MMPASTESGYGCDVTPWLTAYQSLLSRLIEPSEPTYELAREAWSFSMSRAGEVRDGWIYYPAWLLWGALTDWVEKKPDEAGEALSAIRAAARERAASDSGVGLRMLA